MSRALKVLIARAGPEGTIAMLRRFGTVSLMVVVVLALGIGPAIAQSGHILTSGRNAPTCTDIGTQVQCTVKVAGLGGTTFQVDVQAVGIASVVCINPGGNRAPGQDTTLNLTGSSGPQATPRNGAATVTVTTTAPGPLPATPTCPNSQWTPRIVDVSFTTATITLREDGVISDQVTVNVS